MNSSILCLLDSDRRVSILYHGQVLFLHEAETAQCIFDGLNEG